LTAIAAANRAPNLRKAPPAPILRDDRKIEAIATEERPVTDHEPDHPYSQLPRPRCTSIEPATSGACLIEATRS
jgi:hypothetical protein